MEDASGRLGRFGTLQGMSADLPALRRLAGRQGGVFTREQARQRGVSEPRIRRLLRAGEWLVVRRGVLAPAAAAEESSRRLVAEAAAAWLALGRRPVLSHSSAALLHRLVLSQEGGAELTADPRVLR